MSTTFPSVVAPAAPAPTARRREKVLARLCIVALLSVPPLYLVAPLIGIGLAGLSALAVSIWYAVARNRTVDFLYVWSFSAGNLLSLVIAHLGYLYLTDLPRGRHHDLTLELTGILVWSVTVGAIVVDLFFGRGLKRAESPKPELSRVRGWHAIATLGAIFGLLAGAQVAVGMLNARFDQTTESTGWAYVLSGISHAPFLFFFILGTAFRRPFAGWRSLLSVGVLLFWVMAQGLTGGREFSLWMILLFLIGSTTAGLSGLRALFLGGVAAVLGAAFIYVIGVARTVGHFGQAGADDRMEIVVDVARGDVRATGETSTGLEVVLSRAFESSAQLVVDQTEATAARAGFEHFERLAYTFVPKALAPEKLPADDGTEILVRDYGLRLVGNTAVPLPLVADAYRRGGAAWVVAVGLIVGGWLRFVAAVTRWITAPDTLLPIAVLQALFLLRAYTSTVPGLVVVVTYAMVREFVLLFMLIGIVHLVGIATRARATSS